jgi:hypothetical protein
MTIGTVDLGGSCRPRGAAPTRLDFPSCARVAGRRILVYPSRLGVVSARRITLGL